MEFPSHSSAQHIQIPLPFLASAHLLNLSLTACVVYALLLDRCRSSAQHPKFIDDTGVPFVIYPQEQLADACGCGIAKVRAALRVLETASLILMQEQTAPNGMRIAPKIYIRHWAPPREAGYPYGPSVAEILAGTLPICTTENVSWGSYDFIQYTVACTQYSLRARVLYAIIASRTRKASVYAQNKGQTECCTLDYKELRRLLTCSTDSLTRVFAELESNGIIRRVRISTNASMQRIYLLTALPITAKSQDEDSRIECPEPQAGASTAANSDPNQKNNQNNNHNSVITMSNTAETEYVFDIVSSKLNDFYSGESLQRTKDILILAKKYMPKGTSCTSDELLAYVQTVGKKNNIINLESYVKKSINSLQEGGYAAAGKRMKRQFRNNVL